MIYNTNYSIDSPVRQVAAKVELYKDSTLAHTWTNNDRIIKITVERVGDETKFFGYGICQKANVHLIDRDKEITDYTTQDRLDIQFDSSSVEHGSYGFMHVLPRFKITRCNRDENTNELSITAYDALYEASNHTFSELELQLPYTIGDIVIAIAKVLGLQETVSQYGDSTSWDLYYEDAANFGGDESLRIVLDKIAEITQSVYFIKCGDTDSKDILHFQTLRNSNLEVKTLQKRDYITLVNRDNRRLGAITHTTELGDNITASGAQTGTTQFIRDNPLWNMRDDIDVCIQEAWNLVGGLTINQFDCVWRGNFYIELGDRIGLVGKDNQTFYTFLLNDVWEYDGGFRQKTQWVYTNTDTETASSPATLGDILKDTYAKVDKVNREIILVAQDLETIPQEMSSIKLTTDSITSTVASIEKEIGAQDERIDNVEEEIENLSTSMEQTAEQIKIEIKQEILEEGVATAVTTTTGFTFNEEGLRVDKSGNEMSTLISEDGMTIYRDDSEVLVADNTGVYAANLRATTYLIIGVNSRFEDYDNNTRTGCFWIGGATE